MSEIENRVAKVFAELMEVDASSITKESNPETLEEWDSMAHVQLITRLEKEFSVTINPDDAVEFESVGMVCEWLEGKVAQG